MRVLFDSSALYKRYQQEAGSDQVLAASQRATEVVVAAHCKTEIASALSRQRHDGMINPAEYDEIMHIVHGDFEDFVCLPLDKRVENHAIFAMTQNRLRAMDALHIGSAREAFVDLFVTADKRQAQAAQAAGLKIELIEA